MSSSRSHGSEDQFILSPTHTPAKEHPPPRVMISRYATEPSAARNGLLLGKEVSTRTQGLETIPRSPNYLGIATNSKNRPITSELPGTHKADSTSASAAIAPEPLSAGGDVPGGYFSLYQDADSRLHFPHSFHLDADMARQSSQRRAAESSRSSSDARALSPAHASQPALSMPNSGRTSGITSPDTPISSYIPSGVHEDVALPMGKYYPSNWEKRHGKSPQSRPSTATHAAAPVIRSEPQVPKYHGDQAHARPGSDIKRRLQQYQRDMVAQAAMAANALIASSGSAKSAAAAASSLGGGGGVPLPRAQIATNFLKTHKPLSPRLQPVGSPGPVTPMSLEADCYLTTLGGSSAGVEIAPELAAGKGKHRRKDSCSSPAALSAASV